MDIVPENSSRTLTVTLRDLDGNFIPSDLLEGGEYLYRIVDQSEEVVTDWTAFALPTISISAYENRLLVPENETEDRTVYITASYGGFDATGAFYYQIQNLTTDVGSAGLQTLFGNVRTLNWSAGVGKRVYAQIMGTGQVVSGALMLDTKLSTTVDSDGNFTLIVPRGSNIKVWCENHGSHEIIVTSDAARNLATYLTE